MFRRSVLAWWTAAPLRRQTFALACCLHLAFGAFASADDGRGEANTKAERNSAAASVGMDARKLAEIPERLSELVKEGRIAGAVTLIARHGRIVHLEAVGEADIEKRRPMRTDDLFAIASMTKPIAATALMILVDEGKLSLDDPAAKYVPEFGEAALESGPPKRPITIRDLVTHTSGLVGDQQNEGTLAETAAKMAQRPLGFEPGSQWKYSPGVSICGRIVEVVSGMPFERFLDDRIFRPLKMTETTFFPTKRQRERLAKLYRPGKDGTSLAPAEHWIVDFSGPQTANPSGGLFSTARDLARFYRMIANGGELDGKRIVSRDAVKRMTSVRTGDLQIGESSEYGWGLGWAVVREPQDATVMLAPGAFGHGGAFGTQGWIDPEQGMIFVLLIQRTGFEEGDRFDARRAFQQIAVDAISK